MKNKSSKTRKGRNRKTKNVLKIARRLLETRFKVSMKKKVPKIRKMERRTEKLNE